MTAEWKAILISAGFVYAVTALVQAKGLEKIAWKARDCIRIQFCSLSQMFIKNRFQVSGDDCFGIALV